MRKPTEYQIKKAKEVLTRAGYFMTDCMWNIVDIISFGLEMNGPIKLTKDEAWEIAETLEQHFDASLGFQWDNIEMEILSWYSRQTNEKKRKMKKRLEKKHGKV